MMNITNIKKTFGSLFLIAGFMFLACQLVDVECDQPCKELWLDGPSIQDTSLMDTSYLVSKRILTDTTFLQKPVIICVHGFTASTFEWQEFKNREEVINANAIQTSLVLLGGHGRDVETFRTSTWRDWGKPILDEYYALVNKGYRNISFAASSTGGALLLEQIAEGAFDSASNPKKVLPKNIFLIDPIVVSSSKVLSLVKVVGPILGNVPDKGDSTYNAHWYVNRPQEDLQELYDLINKVKNRLESGLTLPEGSKTKVYKSKYDGVTDPISALYLKKGLRKKGTGMVAVEIVNSHLHVFTRLAARKVRLTAADSSLQIKTFLEMENAVLQNP